MQTNLLAAESASLSTWIATRGAAPAPAPTGPTDTTKTSAEDTTIETDTSLTVSHGTIATRVGGTIAMSTEELDGTVGTWTPTVLKLTVRSELPIEGHVLNYEGSLFYATA
jgi:hypothetical protein